MRGKADIADLIRSFFFWLSNSLVGGLLCVLIGIYFIWISIKKPAKKAQIRGWFAGIGFFLLGIWVVVRSL